MRTGVVAASLLVFVGCTTSYGHEDAGRDAGRPDAGEDLGCTIEMTPPIIVEDAGVVRLASHGESVYALLRRPDGLGWGGSLDLARFERGATEPDWITRVFDGTRLALLRNGYLATFASGVIVVAVDYGEREVETLDPAARTLIASYRPDGSPASAPFRSDTDWVGNIVGLDDWIAVRLTSFVDLTDPPLDMLLFDQTWADWPTGALHEPSLRFRLPSGVEEVHYHSATPVRVGSGIGVLFGPSPYDRLVGWAHPGDRLVAHREFDGRGSPLGSAHVLPPSLAVVGPCDAGDRVAVLRQHEAGTDVSIRRLDGSDAISIHALLDVERRPETCAWFGGQLYVLASIRDARRSERSEVSVFASNSMTLQGRAEVHVPSAAHFERTSTGIVVGFTAPVPSDEDRYRAMLSWMECVEREGDEP